MRTSTPPEVIETLAMSVATSRADFERLIDLRLAEAKTLMDHLQDWDGAFYLAGYAVEFAFKVYLIAKFAKPDRFPEKRITDKFYKHDLAELASLTGLKDELEKDKSLLPKWYLVRDGWNEQSRYQFGKSEQEARDLYDAIENGVLPWIKNRW